MIMKLYAIQPEAYKAYKANIDKARVGFDLTEFVNQRKQARLEDGIGHVYVYGALINDATPIERKMGNTDYGDVIQDLNQVVAAGAKAIVLHVNSGGGLVTGSTECATAIQNARVPVVVHSEGTTASAAYKLACGATWLVAIPSCEVGTIGAIMSLVDDSEMMAAVGVQVLALTNDGATLKSTGHLPSINDDQLAFLQEAINEAGEDFRNHVLTNRPNIDETVFNAGWWSGSKALALGLIDELGDESLTIQRATELMVLTQEAFVEV
jgi:protease-4